MFKADVKNIIREIKTSKARFLSLSFIAAIGVAFFVGINASVPIMKGSVDKYYDEQKMMDLQIVSMLGISKNDLSEIAKLEQVSAVQGVKMLDVLSSNRENPNVYKLVSFNLNSKVNKPDLKEGRLPLNSNEVVVIKEKVFNDTSNVMKIGDKISFKSGTSTSINSMLKQNEFSIVGFVESPLYMTHDKGMTNIGNGMISSIVYLPESEFIEKDYAEANIVLKGTSELNCYSDEYFDAIKPVLKECEKLGVVRSKIRYEEIKKKTLATMAIESEKLNNSKTEFESLKVESESLMASISDKLVSVETEYENAKVTIANDLVSQENEIKNAKTQIPVSQSEYEQSIQKVSENDEYFNQLISESDAEIAEMNQMITGFQDLINGGNLDADHLNRAINIVASLQSDLKQRSGIRANQVTEKNRFRSEHEEYQNSILEYIEFLKNAVNNGPALIQEAKANADALLQDATDSLAEGKKAIQEEAIEYKSEMEIAENAIMKAEKDIKNAEVKLEKMKESKWNILDRSKNASFTLFENSADQMGSIALFFPWFFFLVSALVCLTSMTRMVDEQRLEIGTFKALGYNRSAIMKKYLYYAGSASLLGGVLGASIGMYLFPSVIYNAWSLMYVLPPVTFYIQFGIAILAILLTSGITLSATFYVCSKDLKEMPSQLLRPKAPRNGKRILLEKFSVLWSHMSFMHKVTARNIFRYKKRFLMTIIGISGCTALLVAGLGIRESISGVASKQYDEIYKYHAKIEYNEKSTTKEIANLKNSLKEDKSVKSFLPVSVMRGTYTKENEKFNIDLVVPSDVKQFANYVKLQGRRDSKLITLTNNGAVITERLSEVMNVGINEEMKVNDANGDVHTILVKGITENYVGHALYLTQNYYEKAFDSKIDRPRILVKMNENSEAIEKSFGTNILNNEFVDSVEFYSGIKDTFEKTASSLLLVVIVLVISAGCLAFVVLFNLSSVNISERMREIATIKVLGFYDKEVAQYVNRENVVLATFGAFLGFFLGFGLHSIIMKTVEMNDLMFNRKISIYSYISAFVMTLLFTIIVNLVMKLKLKKIKMVESLKSIE